MNKMYREKADKIVSYRTYSDKKKIDALLELSSDQYTNLGTDSTKTEINTAKLTSRYIFRLIKNIDNRLGNLLLRDSLQG